MCKIQMVSLCFSKVTAFYRHNLQKNNKYGLKELLPVQVMIHYIQLGVVLMQSK